MEQMIGRTLHHRYRIQSLLGEQSGRRTFLATDSQTKGQVVIKLVLLGPDFDWETLKLFKREAETLKSLSHPAIPQYLDFFEVSAAGGKGFALVQTYLPAKSLQDWVSAGRRFTEAELQPIARALLGILQYLHSHYPTVIHRDIKPSNILLSEPTEQAPGKVYLVDFGSVQTTQSDGTLTIVGTFGYMPPEQFGGRAYPASDLYSLGATLVYLATGQHPAELIQDNLQLEFEPLIAFSKSFNQWLKQLTYAPLSHRMQTAEQALIQLTRSLSRQDPNKRLLDAQALETAIARLTANAPFQATRADLQLQLTPDQFILQCLQFRLGEPFRYRDSVANIIRQMNSVLIYVILGGWALRIAYMIGAIFLSSGHSLSAWADVAFNGALIGLLFVPVRWTASRYTQAAKVVITLNRRPEGDFSLSLSTLSPSLTQKTLTEEDVKTDHITHLSLSTFKTRLRKQLGSGQILFKLIENSLSPQPNPEPNPAVEGGRRCRRLRLMGTHKEIQWLTTCLAQWCAHPTTQQAYSLTPEDSTVGYRGAINSPGGDVS